MKRRTLIILILLLSVQIGCRPVSMARPRSTATPNPVAVSTPSPTFTTIPTNLPLSTPTHILPTPSLVAQGFPYHDCAKTPELLGCGPDDQPENGMLAFYDPLRKALVSLDLSNGTEWQIPLPRETSLSWSPDGSRLLVDTGSYDMDTKQRSYMIVDHSGRINDRFRTEFAWWEQSEGAKIIKEEEAAHSPQKLTSDTGAEIWIENTQPYTLAIRSKLGAQEQKIVFDSMDWYTYTLLRWFPESQVVLAARASGGSNQMTYGHYLVRINTKTGEVLETGLQSHLSNGVSWNPSQSNLAAILNTEINTEPFDGSQLVILDSRTGKTQPFLPNLYIQEASWSPDGNWLTFFLVERLGKLSAEDQKKYPGWGIYLYNINTEQVFRVVETPYNATDGMFSWLNNGDVLLYARNICQKSQDSCTFEIHTLNLMRGTDKTIVKNIASEYVSRVPTYTWPSFIALRLK